MPETTNPPSLGPALERLRMVQPTARRVWILATNVTDDLVGEVGRTWLSPASAVDPEASVLLIATHEPGDLTVGDAMTVVHCPDLTTRMDCIAPLPRPDAIVDVGRSRGQKVSSLRHLLYALPPGGHYLAGELDAGRGADDAEIVPDVLGTMLEAATAPAKGGRRVRGTDQELGAAVAELHFVDGMAVIRKRGQHFFKLRERFADSILDRRPGANASEIVHRVPAMRFVSQSLLTSHGEGPFADGVTTCDVPERLIRRYRGVVASARQILRDGSYVLPDSWRHPNQPKLNNRQLGYATAWFGGYKPNTEPTSSREAAGSYYYLDTELPGHFGHITTEVLGRVWGWQRVREIDPLVRPLISVAENAPTVPAFQRTIFDALGIPLDEALVVGPREAVTVETLYGPTPQFENPHFVDPAMAEVWRQLSEGLPVGQDPGLGERIFISRRPGGKRDCVNTAEVEEMFTSAGCAIVYPEDYDYPTQRRIFAQAKVVAGFGGSGMFGTMFAPGAQVVVVAGHSYNAANERLFAAGNASPIDYLWGRSEIDMPDGRFSLEAFTSNFTVDVKAFRRTVRRLIR